MKNIFALSVIALLTGCAAGPTFNSDMLGKHPSNMAQIVIYRPSAIMGAAGNPEIKINGKNGCDLPQGSFFIKNVNSGTADLVAISLGTKMGEYKFSTAAGHRYFVEVRVSGGQIAGQMFGLSGALAASSGDPSPYLIRGADQQSAMQTLPSLKLSTACK